MVNWFSTLVAYYIVKIEEEMILRAIKTGQLDFLYCVFCYNKNYEELPLDEGDEDSDDSEVLGEIE